MPRAFSQDEEASIRRRLREVGRDLFGRQGVSKTSVERLTAPARIGKGSFYKFYPSKEALFFELLEEAQNRIRRPLIAGPGASATRPRDCFLSLMEDMLRQLRDEPMLSFLGDAAELAAVARKVPAEVLAAHRDADRRFIHEVIAAWNEHDAVPGVEKVASHFALLLIIQHSQTMLGDRLQPHAEEAVLASLCRCFFADEVSHHGSLRSE
ncbi:MAG: TetR/AcrR family transcriptional regulator [Acidobacteriota bacterium]